ncbi:unnamed protein product [Sphagnum balticum]
MMMRRMKTSGTTWNTEGSLSLNPTFRGDSPSLSTVSLSRKCNLTQTDSLRVGTRLVLVPDHRDRDAPIPRCAVAGHAWGAIECKRDSTWLGSYKNDTISSSSTYKYIFLAANSRFKGQNDRKKYEKARRLKRCIDAIRQDYFRKIEDKDVKNKQLGTATYLIDKLALRVGNEKGEDEADTQDAAHCEWSTLKLWR